MSTFVLVLIIVGFAALIMFHKPKHHTEAELQRWFSSKLNDISMNIEADIEKDKVGEYPHAGKQSFEKRGEITYLLTDKNNARFDISDKYMLSKDDIKQTEGYLALLNKVNGLGLTLKLGEKEVEGDDVDTFDELDEYVDDYPRYYFVNISGW